MDLDSLAILEKHKYVNLETYKKNGQAVQTPVWFMISDNTILVQTMKTTGKIKRIRNNQKIRIMPCGIRGEPKGEWIEGTAKLADDAKIQEIARLRAKKYGFKAKMLGMFMKKENLAGIIIQI
ncbi:MAG: PPOX class F420-dependent oxidoreductase [Nitrososphaeria archaeon]|nr:PPOX class F420-dependent oxidoreductase [Nitrososphaeria archaeon]NDB51663.1 PPOX class F420-dependent oxidoreductase [Nitrosopumilaceae archaeon]NDB92374.1 PPOX class F420-dependent oxidoreductase [Nitrososphaeria archaeon]NDF26564.1 PPOX class F420-dependent oxidoreductase [Nitrosopumilaceae archaeon]NDF29921.1 PPOX class F420-dependent oxidoreductase [Nitrososphaeria archaeon]